MTTQPLTIPALGLGTWKSSNNDVSAAVEHAIKVGYRHIDCAPIYMNEKPLGQAFKNAIDSNRVTRDKLWITSKLWNSFHDPEHVIKALKETLFFMKLDYLDLYLMHWPVAAHPKVGYRRVTDGNDFVSLDDIPLHETWLAMQECKQQGLVKHLGVSNFSISKLQNMTNLTSIQPEVNQIECHPYLSQLDLVAYCREKNIHVTAYAPLGSNDRPDFLKSANEPRLLNNPIVMQIASQLNSTAGQVLLAWSMQHVNSVIPKSIHPGRIEENLLSQKLTLSSTQIESLNKLNIDYRFISGNFFFLPGSPYTKDNLWG